MHRTGPALILLVLGEEWAARAFETILKSRGHAVLKAYTGQQGLGLAAKIRPDILLTELRLPDMTGPDFCRRVREYPTVRSSTPILAFSTEAVSRAEKVEYLRGGLWEVFTPPYDAEEFLSRVERYLVAKRDVDAIVEAGHVDPVTGLYNRQGVLRRVEEIVADVVRSGRSLALVVMAPRGSEESSDEPRIAGGFLVDSDGNEGNGSVEGPLEVVRALGRMMTSTTRLSDSIGRIGDMEFVVVAPGIDAQGAGRLAERLMEAIGRPPGDGPGLENRGLVAGVVSVVGAERGDQLTTEAVLRHARTALDEARLERKGIRVHTFEG